MDIPNERWVSDIKSAENPLRITKSSPKGEII
jgi:hypothetical protein